MFLSGMTLAVIIGEGDQRLWIKCAFPFLFKGAKLQDQRLPGPDQLFFCTKQHALTLTHAVGWDDCARNIHIRLELLKKVLPSKRV